MESSSKSNTKYTTKISKTKRMSVASKEVELILKELKKVKQTITKDIKQKKTFHIKPTSAHRNDRLKFLADNQRTLNAEQELERTIEKSKGNRCSSARDSPKFNVNNVYTGKQDNTLVTKASQLKNKSSLIICADNDVDTKSVKKRNKTKFKGVIRKVAPKDTLAHLNPIIKSPKETIEKVKNNLVRAIKDGNRTIIRTFKNESIISPIKKANHKLNKVSPKHIKDVSSKLKSGSAIKISNKIAEIRRIERQAAITIQRAFKSYLQLKVKGIKYNKLDNLAIRTCKSNINSYRNIPLIKGSSIIQQQQKDKRMECAINTPEGTNFLLKKPRGLRIIQTKKQSSERLSEEQAIKDKITGIASLNKVKAKTEKIHNPSSLSEKESVIYKTTNNTHVLNLSTKKVKVVDKTEMEQPITRTLTGTMKASEIFSNSKTDTLPLTVMKSIKKLNSEEIGDLGTPQFSSHKCTELDIEIGGNEESSVEDIGPIVIKFIRRQELIVWSFSFDDMKDESEVISTEIMGIALGKWDIVIGRTINFERVEVPGGSNLSPWVNISLLIPSCLEMFRSLAKSAFDYNLPLSSPKVADSFNSELNESLFEDFLAKGLIKGTISPNFDFNAIIKALSSLEGESLHNHSQELSNISEYATWNLIRTLESNKEKLEPGEVIEFFSREVVNECLLQIAHSFVLMKEINGKKLKLSKEFDTELTLQKRIRVLRRYMNYKEFVYGNASKAEVDLQTNGSKVLQLFSEVNKSAVNKTKLIEREEEDKHQESNNEEINSNGSMEPMKKVEEKSEPEHRHDFFIQEIEKMKERGEILEKLKDYSYPFCRE